MTTKLKGLEISEQEYRDLPNISYSFLSALDRLGPAGANKEVTPNTAMIFGTMVDSMMDGSFNQKDYYITTSVEIGEKVKPVIDLLLLDIESRMGNLTFSDIDSNLSSYINSLIYVLENNDIDYYKKRTAESRAASIIKDAGAIAYFKSQVESFGKTIITFEMLSDAKECRNILRSNEFTKDIFDDDLPNIEGHYQFKYTWNADGLKYKGMLDRLIIDHENKLIKPYDLKTGGKNVMDFESSFYAFRYDIQAILYYAICKQLQEEFYPDYEVDNFRFVYISRYEKIPLIWEVPLEFLYYVAKGYTRNGKVVKGVKQLVEDYKWYFKNNFNVNFPEKIYKNKGILPISMNGIELLS